MSPSFYLFVFWPWRRCYEIKSCVVFNVSIVFYIISLLGLWPVLESQDWYFGRLFLKALCKLVTTLFGLCLQWCIWDAPFKDTCMTFFLECYPHYAMRVQLLWGYFIAPYIWHVSLSTWGLYSWGSKSFQQRGRGTLVRLILLCPRPATKCEDCCSVQLVLTDTRMIHWFTIVRRLPFILVKVSVLLSSVLIWCWAKKCT